ncbi:MAG: hypothetical protein L3J66_00590 [Bacteroidales bacterium]|nr:hypothetical protein [Bacteroidales bacterium]
MSAQHITNNKLVFYLMTFVFFWLVIGDLITLHQKAIYGYDPFGVDMPFAKTKHKPVHSNFDKGVKFSKVKDQHHVDVLINKEFRVKAAMIECGFEFINTSPAFLYHNGYPLTALRAPPLA